MYDKRQVATIVAALRFFNRHYDEDGQPPIAVREIASAEGEVQPLNPTEVEALAETIAIEPDFGAQNEVTVLAVTEPTGEFALSAYAKPEDAWEAIGAYASIWWGKVRKLKGTRKPDDPRERANKFFEACEDESTYTVVTIDLRWEPKQYATPGGELNL